MYRKSIVHKSIRTGYGLIARTVDTKDNDSVSTADARTQYGIPKHRGDGLIVMNFYPKVKVEPERCKGAVTKPLEKLKNMTVAASFNSGIRVSFVV